jgi:hypothetical protein
MSWIENVENERNQQNLVGPRRKDPEGGSTTDLRVLNWFMNLDSIWCQICAGIGS